MDGTDPKQPFRTDARPWKEWANIEMKLLRDAPLHVAISRASVIIFATCIFVVLGGLVMSCLSRGDCTLSGSLWENSGRFFFLVFGLFLVVVAIVGWVIGVVGFIRGFICIVVMAFSTNDSIANAPWWTRLTVGSLASFPEYLNEQGLQARQKAGRGFTHCLIGFAVFLPALLLLNIFY